MTTKELLAACLGKTIANVVYNGEFSAPVKLVFTDKTALTIDADGDDMAHTIITHEDEIHPDLLHKD